MDLNIQIKTEASLDDAKQIDMIVSQMMQAMDELNSIMNNQLGDVSSGKPVSTTWAGRVSSNWKRYYTNDIPATMEEMKKSATNLRLAVENAILYSNN